ncbi:hypothetical protein GCM10023107_93870 [Actinoplanes octamycinicus]|nr:hypothetical protein Aoc01nite_23520 [Actinoplanes octamycinicus]
MAVPSRWSPFPQVRRRIPAIRRISPEEPREVDRRRPAIRARTTVRRVGDGAHTGAALGGDWLRSVSAAPTDTGKRQTLEWEEAARC